MAFNYLIFSHNLRCWSLAAALLLPTAAGAATYVLPDKGDVVGQIQHTTVGKRDTLFSIARRFDVGIGALMRANPSVDVEKPGMGTRILLPTRHILPSGPREGVVINAAELRLYHYFRPPEGPALVSVYPIGWGATAGPVKSRGGFKVDQRLHKPSWDVPKKLIASTRKQGRALPDVLPPSAKGNPFGDYVMHLGESELKIHSAADIARVGRRGGRGYISLYPEDMNVLVHRTPKGTSVRVVNEAFKVGYTGGRMYFEIHKPVDAPEHVDMRVLVNRITQAFSRDFGRDEWRQIKAVAEQGLGVALPVARGGVAAKSRKKWMLQVKSYKSAGLARALVYKVDRLGVPVSMRSCDDAGLCKVMVGPFSNKGYMGEVAKRIRWITRIRAKTVPYEEEVVERVHGAVMADAANGQ